MNRSRTFLATAGLMVTALSVLLITGVPFSAMAQRESPPIEPQDVIGDLNKNGIFDNLEARTAGTQSGQPFDVIIVFNNDLEEVDFPVLKATYGEFATGARFNSINALAAQISRLQIEQLAAHPSVRQIEADAIVLPHLDTSKEWVGVNKARTDFGYDGNRDGNATTFSATDITIAVLDSGVNSAHSDLGGGKVIGWRDFINGNGTPYDESQCDFHGTHVSSIAAGSGDVDSTLAGVAPGAALVVGKVIGHQTGGGPPGCFGTTTQVNAGIQWIIDNKLRNSGTPGGDAPDWGIDVLNMSLGSDGCSDGTDSQSLLVNAVAAAGIIPVVSAGNDGPEGFGGDSNCSLGTPAAAEDAITVAAMADPDHGASVGFGCGNAPAGGFYLVCFSSRGPTLDGRFKPEIAAPGVLINAADGATSGGSSAYTQLSGTSMASPFTAGVVGLLQHARLANSLPVFTADGVKQVLMLTAEDWGALDGSTGAWSGPRSDIDFGAGLINAYRAIQAVEQLSGTDVVRPQHQFIDGTLTEATGFDPEDTFILTIGNPNSSIGVTLIMPEWASGQPDFDLQLIDKDSTVVSSASTAQRQETVGTALANNGPYTVRVNAWPGNPQFPASTAGRYFLDISADTELVGINILTDGWLAFGARGTSSTVDTTTGGINDVQTVQISAPPAGADVFLRTTAFTDGVDIWSLGTTPGADTAVWEFSTDGATWTRFTSTGTLHPVATALSDGATVDFYFRLTLPSSVSTTREHGATVTMIVSPSP